MKKFISIIAAGLLVMTFIGCSPQRVSVTARYNSPYYSHPPRPYPDYVWMEGGWYFNNGSRVYRQGYWAPPSRYHSGYSRHSSKYRNRGRRY